MTTTATAENIHPGDTITPKYASSFVVHTAEECPCIDDHFPGRLRHYRLKPRTGSGIIAPWSYELPVQRGDQPQPITCQPAYAVGYLFTGDDWASLPPETLLVDAWGAAYRIGWRFMNTAARTVSRYNTAGQGHPEVYDMDEAPAITADAQLRIVHLGH